MHTLLHSVPPTPQQATADPRLHRRPLDPHGQVWVSLLWGHWSWCTQGYLCALQESASPVLCKFWGSMVGLMVISSKRAYAIPKSAPRAPDPVAIHRPIPPQKTLKHSFFSVSVGSLCPGVHKVLLEPSECLWWVWDLILNVILPLLPSC